MLSQIELEPLVAFMHPAISLTISTKQSTILVIDDGNTLHQYLCERFRKTYEIVVARSNQEGLDMAMSIAPDLIITGLNTVDVERDPLCFRLKQSCTTSHIPILILSDQHTLGARIKCFYYGADDCLTWPFLLVELQIRIHNLIQSRKLIQRKYSALGESTCSSQFVESADKLFLQRAMAVVEEHLKNSQFGSEVFAKEMGLSQRQLRRKLIALSGIPVNEFIRRIRLLQAGELLAKNAGNVSEVAYRVGFNNLSYFAKCFKALHGSLPNEYVKRCLG